MKPIEVQRSEDIIEIKKVKDESVSMWQILKKKNKK